MIQVATFKNAKGVACISAAVRRPENAANGAVLAAAPNVVAKARALVIALDSHFPDEPFLRAEVEALRAALAAAGVAP